MPVEFFRDHPIVRTMTEQQRARLVEYLRPVEFHAGDPLCEQGEFCPGLFLLTTGNMRVTQRQYEDTDEILITHLTGPTVVGELELIGGTVSACSVIADSITQGSLLTHDAFVDLAKKGDSVAAKLVANIAHVVVNRLVESNRRYLAMADPDNIAALSETLTSWELPEGPAILWELPNN